MKLSIILAYSTLLIVRVAAQNTTDAITDASFWNTTACQIEVNGNLDAYNFGEKPCQISGQ